MQNAALFQINVLIGVQLFERRLYDAKHYCTIIPKSVKAVGARANRRVRFLHVCGWVPLSEKLDCLNCA